jgi:hypothetical protein
MCRALDPSPLTAGVRISEGLGSLDNAGESGTVSIQTESIQKELRPMHLPVLIRQAHDATASRARSARPLAPQRHDTVASPARRRSPGVVRQAAASALRRSADRLAPVIE